MKTLLLLAVLLLCGCVDEQKMRDEISQPYLRQTQDLMTENAKLRDLLEAGKKHDTSYFDENHSYRGRDGIKCERWSTYIAGPDAYEMPKVICHFCGKTMMYCDTHEAWQCDTCHPFRVK